MLVFIFTVAVNLLFGNPLTTLEFLEGGKGFKRGTRRANASCPCPYFSLINQLNMSVLVTDFAFHGQNLV